MVHCKVLRGGRYKRRQDMDQRAVRCRVIHKVRRQVVPDNLLDNLPEISLTVSLLHPEQADCTKRHARNPNQGHNLKAGFSDLP